MPDRAAAIDAMLRHAGWSEARRTPIAGDASARRYSRLRGRSGTAILMDAPPDTCAPIDAFVATTAHLRSLGLSAPAILGADTANGLAVIEDLGDGDFLRVIEAGLAPEKTLYLAALDALHVMQSAPPPDTLRRWDAVHMADITRPAFEEGPGGSAGFDRWQAALCDALAPLTTGPLVFCHRDFHAGNLFWLPERVSAARVGIIDHQDAFAGPAAYDLVSLLTDARRDLSPGLSDLLTRRWLHLTGGSAQDLDRDMTLLSVQRNLRVLGVLTRLARSGRATYAQFLPRVRRHLTRALAGVPRLTGLAEEVGA